MSNGFDFVDIASGIRSKAIADGELMSKITGMFYGEAPDKQKFPYCVFFVVVQTLEKASYKGDSDKLQIQFSLFDDSPSAIRISEAMKALTKVYDDTKIMGLTTATSISVTRDQMSLDKVPEDRSWMYWVSYNFDFQPN